MFRRWTANFQRKNMTKPMQRAIFHFNAAVVREWRTRYIKDRKNYGLVFQARSLRKLLTFRGGTGTRRSIPSGVLRMRAMDPRLDRIAHPSLALGPRPAGGGQPLPKNVTGKMPYRRANGRQAKGYAAGRSFRIPWDPRWRTSSLGKGKHRHGIVGAGGRNVQLKGQRTKMIKLMRNTVQTDHKKILILMNRHFSAAWNGFFKTLKPKGAGK